MKLTDRHHDILKRALDHGRFVPQSRQHVDACLELEALLFMKEEDRNSSLRCFNLTPMGERFVAAINGVPKSAKVYVFATHSI